MSIDPKTLPRDITSYDLLKTVAVILMLVDHAGYYFFPDNEWWRVFGRFCVPIWFFLIGYARSRDLDPRLWTSLVILLGANIITGMSLLPLNIMATMIITRLTIDHVARFASQNRVYMAMACLALSGLAMSTGMFFEYGTLGIMMAYFGWLVRRQDEIPDGHQMTKAYLIMSYVCFVILQVFGFNFQGMQLYVFLSGTLAVMGILLNFKPQTYPVVTQRLGPVAAVLRFAGRCTPEIYTAHLVLYKFLGLFLIEGRQQFFDWKLFSANGF